MRYRAVLFDLFGTLILFKPQEPAVRAAGARWRSTMDWLRGQVGGELPDIAFADFVAAMAAVTEEILRDRLPEHREVLSQERFRRALARIGVAGEAGADIAQRLSQRHMDHLASSTVMPVAHGALLRALAPQYPIGLVSNFDHAPTARRLLVENGIAELLQVTIISGEFGRRKPHPSIFHAALDALGVRASAALYVGDTLFDDVSGARGAGMDVAWINAQGTPAPAASEAPTYTIRRLIEIEALLGGSGWRRPAPRPSG